MLPLSYRADAQRRRLASLAVLFVVACFGCDMPRDPQRTYERVRDGTLRVGITEHRPWTFFHHGQPRGIEVQIVQDLARHFNARIEWKRGSESQLVQQLQDGQLDLVIGGLSESNPWAKRVGTTRPYATWNKVKYVMFVQQGENRWLLELDTFLRRQKARIARMLQPHVRP